VGDHSDRKEVGRKTNGLEHPGRKGYTTSMSDGPFASGQCSGPGSDCVCDECQALRTAALAGARPRGVPQVVYNAYLDARAALRADAPTEANRLLERLLGYLAEERGARPEQNLAAKLDLLRAAGVLSPRLRQSLFDEAASTDDTVPRAWAMMSIAEHAFYRLYL